MSHKWNFEPAQPVELFGKQKTPHDAPWMNSCQGRDPKFYTARTKRAVNSLTVERGPKGGAA